MKIKFFSYFLFCFFISSTIVAQRIFVNRDWSQFTGIPDSINYSSSAVDQNGNLIVVSNTKVGTNNTDILIAKYNEGGILHGPEPITEQPTKKIMV